jgi:hypothetical protein
VVLNWTSEPTLDFAVVVAGEGEANHVLLAQRNHTLTVPVDLVRKYCFLVQASDSGEGTRCTKASRRRSAARSADSSQKERYSHRELGAVATR